MKLYSSFVLRCWVIREEAEKIVFDVEHVQKGKRHRSLTPEETMRWILGVCQTSEVKEADTDPDDVEEQLLRARNTP